MAVADPFSFNETTVILFEISKMKPAIDLSIYFGSQGTINVVGVFYIIIKINKQTCVVCE